MIAITEQIIFLIFLIFTIPTEIKSSLDPGTVVTDGSTIFDMGVISVCVDQTPITIMANYTGAWGYLASHNGSRYVEI